MATTAILIVNWNGRKFLEECFAALRAQTLAPDRILLVDNGSTDGSVDWMKENAPTVEVLALGRNTGFAEGNNIGLRKLFENPPTYVALLNNDTRAEPQWLEALVSELEKDASLGSAASCMVYHSKPEEVNNAGDQPLWDGAGIARGRHRPDEEFAIPAEVFGPCGGAALYRLEALRQCALGDDYFDSGYFAYNEDVDLSWRLRRRGWKCLYVAGARVLHHHGGSSGRFSPFVLYHGERNRCWTLLKNFSWLLIAAAPFYTIARLLRVAGGGSEGTAAGYRATTSMGFIAWTLIRAWCAALAGFPRMLLKRWKYGLGWPYSKQAAVLREFGAALTQAERH